MGKNHLWKQVDNNVILLVSDLCLMVSGQVLVAKDPCRAFYLELVF